MIIDMIEDYEDDSLDLIPQYLLELDLVDTSVDEIEKQTAEIVRIIGGQHDE